MPHRFLATGLVLLVMAFALASCRSAPIQNMEGQAIPSNAGVKDLEQVTKAIQRAGVSLGWNMKVQEPGHIIGTLNIRSHMAKVDIEYSKTGYSITYRDSRNLEKSGDTIHSNYNGWIQNLDNKIQRELLST